jgi:hypothetical protein
VPLNMMFSRRIIRRWASNPDYHPLSDLPSLDVHIGRLKLLFCFVGQGEGSCRLFDILVGLRSFLKTEEIVKEESNENMLKGVVIGSGFIICAECSFG